MTAAAERANVMMLADDLVHDMAELITAIGLWLTPVGVILSAYWSNQSKREAVKGKEEATRARLEAEEAKVQATDANDAVNHRHATQPRLFDKVEMLARTLDVHIYEQDGQFAELRSRVDELGNTLNNHDNWERTTKYLADTGEHPTIEGDH